VVSILSSFRMLIGSGFADSSGLLTLLTATLITSFRLLALTGCG
jgi:hypothetical protein